jgi:hypothetical protein
VRTLESGLPNRTVSIKFDGSTSGE